MRFADPARSELIVNDFVRLTGIPAAAHGYEVNGRTPLGWFLDRYRITKDRESGIVNDPNAWFAAPRDRIPSIRFQVSPPSVERYTPFPSETLLRMCASPVLTQTTLGSAAETAIAPTERAGWPSKSGVQWTPPSFVRKTPPETAPKQQVSG